MDNSSSFVKTYHVSNVSVLSFWGVLSKFFSLFKDLKLNLFEKNNLVILLFHLFTLPRNYVTINLVNLLYLKKDRPMKKKTIRKEYWHCFWNLCSNACGTCRPHHKGKTR